ncbi:hypothetical protein TRIP_B200439 [uncultured Desulfatiglans sp.]|nr:hypothetical protein TRIP_B200439 [uncultured Desulfatiglans sp.]
MSIIVDGTTGKDVDVRSVPGRYNPKTAKRLRTWEGCQAG